MTGSASGNAELRPGCYAGAAAPEQVVCVVAFGRLASCGRRVISSVRFFGPVFLINWVLYILYGFGPGFPYKLGQLYYIYSSGENRPS